MALFKPSPMVSKGIKPVKGLAATTIDDMMETIAYSDPDSVGSDNNEPPTPYLSSADALPPMGKGSGQSDE